MPKNAEKRRKTPKIARLIPPKKRSTATQNSQITKNRWQEQERTADTNVGACWTGVFLRRGVSSGLFVVVLCFGQNSA